MTIRPFAFVLMPFTSDFNDIYKLGIQAACTDADVIAERVDEQTYTETILERIYRQIQVSDFVIADMTGKNPNVFYEVGYAHALGKFCTLLTQSADDIPFDLKHHRHIVYDGSIEKLKKLLAIELEWLKAESGKAKTQAISIDLNRAVGLLEKEEWSISGSLELVFDLHNRTEKRSPEIEAVYVFTSENWNFHLSGGACPVTQVEDGPAKYKFFVTPPVSRLSQGGWAQIKLDGSRQFWNKYSGAEEKDTYRTSGKIYIQLQTSEGLIQYAVQATTEFDDVPF
jgi:hypothetical protein